MSRQPAVDVLKLVCAFLVACIHFPFPGVAGAYVMAVGRVAVPVFFLITGYYYARTVASGGKWRQVGKIARLLLLSLSLYLGAGLWAAAAGGRLPMYLETTLRLRVIAQFLLFNHTPAGGHIWYLSACLYVLVLSALLSSRLSARAKARLPWLAAALLVSAAALDWGVFGYLRTRQLPTPHFCTLRNWLFTGLPYFLFGTALSTRRDRIEALPAGPLWLAAGALLAVNLLEYSVLAYFRVETARDQYLTTPLLALALFLLAARAAPTAHTGRLFSALAFLGRHCTTTIYVVHLLLGQYSMLLLSNCGLMDSLGNVLPVLVFGCSLLCALAVFGAKAWYNGRRNPPLAPLGPAE